MFTIVATVTLSLGIGASTAVLGVIDTLFFMTLPVPHPERVIAIYLGDRRDRDDRRHLRSGFSTVPDYLSLRRRVQGVTGLASYTMASVAAGPAFDGAVWTALFIASTQLAGRSTRDVHSLLPTEAAQLVGTGATIGLVCAIGLVQIERGWLGPVLSADAKPIAASLAILLAISGMAALIPSWKAAHQPPGDVLRSS
jgi:predicted lysophospholipase L1 biosynthesis ABC-type transport system permease subunit